MEEQMKYILMPSLQRRALIKTAVTVWNQDDVRAFSAEMMKSMSFIERRKKWQVVEDKVIEKVQVLPLPELLKIRLVDFAKPIFLQVLRWWECHESYFDKTFIKESLNKICWTPQGTVDKKKTAEAIIRDEDLELEECYKIACIYCLKNDILMLWNKMPESRRKFFYCEEDPADVIQHPLVVVWTYDVKGEMTRLENFTRISYRCTSYQYALKGAVLDGNQVATEYFLQKLSSEEREQSLLRFAGLSCIGTIHSVFSCNVDVVCFLLSQMNEEQQKKVLKICPQRVLLCLLHWPWQDLFMKMAKLAWASLPEGDFRGLLKEIITKVKDGFKDYDYQYLFSEFWQQSPIALKENFRDFLLVHLLQIKDKGNIKLILEDLSAPDKEEVIFSTCERLICNDGMDSLEFFVQECLTAKDITIKLVEREEFDKRLIRDCSETTLEKEKHMWIKVFQLLDDLTQKCDDQRCVKGWK